MPTKSPSSVNSRPRAVASWAFQTLTKAATDAATALSEGAESAQADETQVFIETPYRNDALLQALTQTLQHNTRLAVARGLTLASASVRSETVKGWRGKPQPADERAPAVFAIGR